MIRQCLKRQKSIRGYGSEGIFCIECGVQYASFRAAGDGAGRKIAMYLNGTWLPNEVKDTAGSDFNWGEFAFTTVRVV